MLATASRTLRTQLEEEYSRRTVNVVPGMLLKILHLKFDEGEGMRAYISKLKQLEMDLI